MNVYDVFSYGVVSTSRLIMIEGDFPKANHYAEVDQQYRMVGGEAANSSIALSCLGIKVKLDGNWLGKNEYELETLKLLKAYEIDTSRLTLKEDYIGPNEIVVTDLSNRTIFGNYGKIFGNGSKWNDVCEDDIKDAKVVCLDPFFKEASDQVASISMKYTKPYVTVDCAYNSFLAQNADVVIIAGDYRSHHYQDFDIQDLFEKYLSFCKGLVIFTSGSQPILYGRNQGKLRMFEPFDVQVIDTSCAGDSFRAGIIYGMLKGCSDQEMIKYGSAVSAMVCMSFPGVLKAPCIDEVEAFIARYT